MNFVVAVQASSQLDTVYGSAYANELRDTFPAALVMFGAAEMDMLHRAEEWTPADHAAPGELRSGHRRQNAVVTAGFDAGLPSAAAGEP